MRGKGSLAPRILNFQMQMVSFKIQQCNPRGRARWEVVELKKLLPLYIGLLHTNGYTLLTYVGHMFNPKHVASQQKQYKDEF